MVPPPRTALEETDLPFRPVGRRSRVRTGAHAHGGRIALPRGGGHVLGRDDRGDRLRVEETDGTSRRPEDSPDGGAGRLHLRFPDDQLHDPRNRLERASRGRDDPRGPPRTARRLPRHGIGADGPGALLRRRGITGPRVQHLEPRDLPVLRRLPAGLQAAGRGRQEPAADPPRVDGGRDRRAPDGRLLGRPRNAPVGKNRAPVHHVPPDDAADPPGHRGRRGVRHGGRDQLRPRGPSGDPRQLRLLRAARGGDLPPERPDRLRRPRDR